ncbi:MAG: SOS response-associated peptidase family protein [Pseudohongiellaceae bacterium]
MNVIDSPEIRYLMEVLGVDLYPLRNKPDIAPGSVIQIIHQKDGRRHLSDAIWWLFLDSSTLKPNYKYASFNSRSDKLNSSKSIAYKPYRQSRCIIPASAFVEGLGDKKTYHKISLENSAIAFGGLYKETINQATGESVYSASVITLPPPLPEWENIHPKSMPLILPFADNEIIDKWLDPNFCDVKQFDSLLEPKILQPQKVCKIAKASKWDDEVEEPYMITSIAQSR